MHNNLLLVQQNLLQPLLISLLDNLFQIINHQYNIIYIYLINLL